MVYYTMRKVTVTLNIETTTVNFHYALDQSENCISDFLSAPNTNISSRDIRSL